MSRLIGRAEYENIAGKKLFEQNVQEAYPWLFRDNASNGTFAELRGTISGGYRQRKAGIFAAPRGSGKTLYLRKVAEKIPLELHMLEKVSLDFIGKTRSNGWRCIVDCRI